MTTVTEACIAQVAEDIHTNAINKGFWEQLPPLFGLINSKLLLIISEVIEAMDVIRTPPEDSRNGFPRLTEYQREEFVEELADVIIRTFDLAEYLAMEEIGAVILSKMEKNSKRPYLHRKAF